MFILLFIFRTLSIHNTIAILYLLFIYCFIPLKSHIFRTTQIFGTILTKVDVSGPNYLAIYNSIIIYNSISVAFPLCWFLFPKAPGLFKLNEDFFFFLVYICYTKIIIFHTDNSTRRKIFLRVFGC